MCVVRLCRSVLFQCRSSIDCTSKKLEEFVKVAEPIHDDQMRNRLRCLSSSCTLCIQAAECEGGFRLELEGLGRLCTCQRGGQGMQEHTRAQMEVLGVYRHQQNVSHHVARSYKDTLQHSERRSMLIAVDHSWWSCVGRWTPTWT